MTRDWTQYRRWSETADSTEMTRDCGHSTGDDRETADTVQEMTADIVQETETADSTGMTRDCGHSTGDGQTLGVICYRKPGISLLQSSF
ncbi:unnamed protein product, partial [Staurois parvus]